MRAVSKLTALALQLAIATAGCAASGLHCKARHTCLRRTCIHRACGTWLGTITSRWPGTNERRSSTRGIPAGAARLSPHGLACARPLGLQRSTAAGEADVPRDQLLPCQRSSCQNMARASRLSSAACMLQRRTFERGRTSNLPQAGTSGQHATLSIWVLVFCGWLLALLVLPLHTRATHSSCLRLESTSDGKQSKAGLAGTSRSVSSRLQCASALGCLLCPAELCSCQEPVQQSLRSPG